jgi:hypothetical protein
MLLLTNNDFKPIYLLSTTVPKVVKIRLKLILQSLQSIFLLFYVPAELGRVLGYDHGRKNFAAVSSHEEIPKLPGVVTDIRQVFDYFVDSIGKDTICALFDG